MVQRQNVSFPRTGYGFNSRYPLSFYEVKTQAEEETKFLRPLKENRQSGGFLVV